MSDAPEQEPPEDRASPGGSRPRRDYANVELRRPEFPQPRQSSAVSIVLAALGLAGICLVLFFLSGGIFGIVILMAGGIVAFAGLQYLIWGWWLGKMIRREEEQDEERESQS